MNLHARTGIRWIEEGDGPDLLVLHGLGVDHRLLAAFAAETLPGFRRVLVDLPGHGESVGTGVASIDDVADLVAAFTDDVLSGRFAVVGTSFGGAIARGLLARRTGKVRGIALLAPMVVSAHADRRLPDLDAVIGDLPAGASASRWYDAFASITHRQDAETWRLFERDAIPGAELGDALEQGRISDRYEYAVAPEDAFGSFDGPALLLLGRHDTVVGWEDAVALAPYYPAAGIIVAPAAGHNVHHESGDLGRSALRDWADSVLRAGVEIPG